jgi:hypothetical protein
MISPLSFVAASVRRRDAGDAAATRVPRRPPVLAGRAGAKEVLRRSCLCMRGRRPSSAGRARNLRVRLAGTGQLIDCSTAIHRTGAMLAGAQANRARARSEMAITAGLRTVLSTVIA